MTPTTDRRAWGEAAGQLRYLSIRLQGYVAELPGQSLPPRGRVQWSQTEVDELGALTRLLARGENDAARAAASLEAIGGVFRRPRAEAPGSANALPGAPQTASGLEQRSEAQLLVHYQTQRAIAMDALPRLQRFGEAPREQTRNAAPAASASRWRALWRRTLSRLRPRRVR